MTADARRARSIFLKAVEERRPDQWRAYLDETCGGDAALRERVEVLLQAHAMRNSLLDAPAGLVATVDRPIAEQPGETIGSYKLLEQIGEGGFGVVFMAEQQEPVRRKVALKVLKPGMDTRQVVARFEAERQALALMDHPHIARVFDGGTTGTGRPYFVMELVRGVPITEFCDESCLTIRQRLELFVDVCQAVQHAHQKGIIHRDIKPTNVMVTMHDGTPVVKVIDFGVAKAMGQQLTEKTLFTNFAQMVGTPLYMSPEQAAMSGLDIDTRGDIYSLGVLMYELLTGTTPFENERLLKAGYDEMRRIIREEEPPKPSTRISTVGKLATTACQNRQTDPKRLSRLFRGELDWIVMKALEKNRNRRYETANGFARDVQRYLADEPVQACPPSAAYRLRKFARRHKRILASTAVVAVAGLVIAATVGWAVRDRDARAQRADRERTARRLAVEQAVGRALERADELEKQGKWQEALVSVERAEAALTSGEGGEEARQQVHDQLADLQLVQRLEDVRAGKQHEHEHEHRAFATVFADFGIEVESLSPPEVAARIRRRPNIAVRVAAALDDWAIVLRDWGLFDRTRDPATWKRLLEAARLADPDPWRSQLRQLMGQEDLSALRNLAETSDMSVLPVQSLQLMGTALIFGGDAPACVAWLRRAHRHYPDDDRIAFDLSFHLSNLPAADWVEVLRFAEARLAARPSADTYCWVAHVLSRLGRGDEAIACCRKAIEIDPNDAKAHHVLGQVHARKRQWKEAAASLARATELDPNDNWTAHQLAIVLAEQGDLPAYQKLCDTMLARLGTVANPRGAELTAKACLLLPGGVPDPARLAPLIQKALSADEKYELYPWLLFARGLHDYRCGRFAEAVTACRNSGQQASATHNDALLVQSQSIEAMSLFRLGQADEARQVLAAAGRMLYEKRPEFGSGDLREWWESLLGCRVLLREAEQTMGTRWPQAIELDPNDAKGHIDLGQIYARQGQWKQAAAAFDRALEIDPANRDVWTYAAAARAALGDLENYRRTCAQIAQRFADATDKQTVERCAKACLLMHEALDAADFDRVQKMADRAVTGTQNDFLLYPFCAMVKGLAEYRAGHYAEAIQWTEVSAPRVDGTHWEAIKFSILAMAQHRLGHSLEARAALDNAQAILTTMPDPAKGELFGAFHWFDWVHAQVLCREAEELVEADPPASLTVGNAG